MRKKRSLSLMPAKKMRSRSQQILRGGAWTLSWVARNPNSKITAKKQRVVKNYTKPIYQKVYSCHHQSTLRTTNSTTMQKHSKNGSTHTMKWWHWVACTLWVRSDMNLAASTTNSVAAPAGKVIQVPHNFLFHWKMKLCVCSVVHKLPNSWTF